MSKKETVRNYLMQDNPRSAWAKGIREYALELLENVEDEDLAFSNAGLLRKALLNGASERSGSAIPPNSRNAAGECGIRTGGKRGSMLKPAPSEWQKFGLPPSANTTTSSANRRV